MKRIFFAGGTPAHRSTLFAIAIVFIFLFPISNSLQAQQHREKWEAADYFPEHHFVPTNADDYWDSVRIADKAGEVAFYMRLAGLMQWKDTSKFDSITSFRLTLLPQYSHPIFIGATIDDTAPGQPRCIVAYNFGNAVCGYVEHTTYWDRGDSGWLDVTEQHYHGNQWVEGRRFRGDRFFQLSGGRLDTLDLPHHPHTTCWGGYRPPYVLEYRSGWDYNAVYDECYGEALGRFVDYLLGIVLGDSADVYVYSPNRYNKVVPASFPGGDTAFRAFIEANLRYPERALAALEESTKSLTFIVERDGRLVPEMRGVTRFADNEDPYGFWAEAERLLSLMPRWEPATKKGRPVRSHASVNVRFQLPDSVQPRYGSPQLETWRDSSRWGDIVAANRRLLIHPQSQECCYRMASLYYQEFILPRKMQRIPNEFDSIRIDKCGGWDSFFDCTPVTASPADSALRYYYRALEATDSVDQERAVNMYLPIRGLEQYLGREPNPLNRLPEISGLHYPADYFIDLPEDGILDTAVDYLFDCSYSDSYFWTQALSGHLALMDEPVLYDSLVDAGDTVYRFAFYPSFDPTLVFRMERTGRGATLHWARLNYAFDENTLTTVFLPPTRGERKLRKKEYRRVMALLADLDFDHAPRMQHRLMIDGAQWCIERRTADTFKAAFTNTAGKKHEALFEYLVRLADIDADYVMRAYTGVRPYGD